MGSGCAHRFIALVIIIAALVMPWRIVEAADGVAGGAGLAPWGVEGNELVAGGKPLRLRGLDWGWWHLMGTRYSQSDMQNVAKWGANVVRLSFSYSDLETDGEPAVWKEQGFGDLDEVVRWAKQYGIYVILDMHVVPGGQSTAAYCAGGHNLIWTNAGAQERFVALWREIARRYRDWPEVGAYELMNEPGSGQKTPDLLRRIDQRAIDTIRAIDPEKVIVIGGDDGSGPGALTDAMKFSDSHILYTIHWYIGAGGNEDWLGTQTQEPGISSAGEGAGADASGGGWSRLEYTFTAPANADHMCALLRSSGNSGSAWFDDVEVDHLQSGAVPKQVLQSASFDHNAQGYRPEGYPERMAFDASFGHDNPGSLKLHGTIGPGDWSGWAGPRLLVRPGEQYRISAWVKLDHATGKTYLAAAFFRNDTQLDQARFEKEILPAAHFAKRFNVPVWVGEFGCDASSRDMQVRWVSACISLFEQNGFSWTYWNDKETSDPNGMGVQAEHADGSDFPVNERLLGALRGGWALNRR